MATWREQMCDLAAFVWTARKATPAEVREEIRQAVGVTVAEEVEDALSPLADEEVRSVLHELHIKPDDVRDHSDLCVQCFAVPGECKPSCGLYEEQKEAEDGSVYDPPSTEKGMEDLLEEALTEKLEDLCGGRTEPRWNIRSFRDAQVLTDNKGLVVKLGGREFQITVVCSR